ncbi:hypothetical protein RYD26_12445 [Pasteurellaceae bacterium LIM206]|nr:hypothetical protein [Pasteurellaceae bacterium LIM206]
METAGQGKVGINASATYLNSIRKNEDANFSGTVGEYSGDTDRIKSNLDEFKREILLNNKE